MTELREALERVMGLAEKATPGEWARGWSNDTGPNDDYYVEWQEAGPAQVHGRNQDADADAIAAALNLLRDHGPALLEAVRDAERYRWLKSNGIIRVLPIASGMMSRGGTRILADTKDWLPGDFTYVIDGVTKDVDAAIDAAIAAQRQEPTNDD